ncbi:MAG: hypothetical protein ACP5XB_22850 [Isosphaeraceae bacterium]
MLQLADLVREAGDAELASLYEQKAAETRRRVDSLRRTVMHQDALGNDSIPDASREAKS